VREGFKEKMYIVRVRLSRKEYLNFYFACKPLQIYKRYYQQSLSLFLLLRLLCVLFPIIPPPRMVTTPVQMQVNPQLLLRVIFHTRVRHIMQPIQRARHYVRYLVFGQGLVYVLRLLQ
jgi:hypothetical protein